MKIPYIESPSFNSPEEGEDFDLSFIEVNPDCLQYVRLCSPNEIPRVQRVLFEGVGPDPEKKTFKLVFRIGPGKWTSHWWNTWNEMSPKDYYDRTAHEFAKIIELKRACYEA